MTPLSDTKASSRLGVEIPFGREVEAGVHRTYEQAYIIRESLSIENPIKQPEIEAFQNCAKPS